MILRLSQFAEAQAHTFRVELSLDNAPPVRTRFSFSLSPQDQEDLRWYLEDYLQYPFDPAPTIAARIETRMRDVGIELFKHIFQSSDDARDLWSTLRPRLNDTRIEIITEIKEATSIPWELLRDPRTDEPLALNARTFVRAPINPVRRRPSPSKREGEKIRILLVICRPKAGEDVPFRSVASRIVKSLSEEAHEIVQLDVLRPPTFEQLGKALREAKFHGEPYHVVHFDGHGVYDHADKRGYVIFENQGIRSNFQYVNGADLGNLLINNNVSTLVLNACQSAFAEAPTAPLAEDQAKEVGTQVRAFGSLAQEVMDTGVAGIVAMRYILYVETAKRFVADLYAALTQGQSLGEAVTFGRKQLAINPQREIAYQPINLQDWPVPIVYETMEIHLFPRRAIVGAIHVETIHELSLRELSLRELSLREFAPRSIIIDKEMTQRGTEIGLPPRPDVGFFGRDETLLALDRTFDSQKIVLLHAFAGSGKTTTVVEFARWYALTGGVQGPIFFSSFEHRKTLTDALNETIVRAFNDALEQSGVHWLTLTDDQRRTVALQVMRQVPMLWIWDNVEPIAGFPAGTKSAWSEQEQIELKKFLTEARETKAKFLLTSRRDEQKWLGDLPRRIIVPPMPMQERVQLARALAEKLGHRITDVEDWRPLLQFTQGNPLTITVLVGQALRDGLKTKKKIEDFVERLRKGEAAFADEQSEGRSKSLGASLSYGFENTFTETERKQLAILHFFQGFVNVHLLNAMGQPDWALPELRGFIDDYSIRLLDRAAEIGLLTTHGNGNYSIHPSLPWYFKNLFDKYYLSDIESNRSEIQSSGSSKQLATRAFVETMSSLGHILHNEYGLGNPDMATASFIHEANLKYAWQLAREHAWWNAVIGTMQGLKQLYIQAGRTAEWEQLVNETVHNFVNLATDEPLLGQEENWNIITQHRVLLDQEAGRWENAERLQRKQIDQLSRKVSEIKVPKNHWKHEQQNIVRKLIIALEQLGQILRDQKKSECVSAYEEAIRLSQENEDYYGLALTALNLSNAYRLIPSICDFSKVEYWCKVALEFTPKNEIIHRALCFSQLGSVAFERFVRAASSKKSKSEIISNFNDAVQFYQQALDLLPPDAVNYLATMHNEIGALYYRAGEFEYCLMHYREAILYSEGARDFFKAAKARFNYVIALEQAGRLADAREYALAALRNFETFGDSAAELIEQTKGLIARIEEQMSSN